MPRRTSRIPASEEIQAASADTEALAETGAAETEVDSSRLVHTSVVVMIKGTVCRP